MKLEKKNPPQDIPFILGNSPISWKSITQPKQKKKKKKKKKKKNI